MNRDPEQFADWLSGRCYLLPAEPRGDFWVGHFSLE